MPIVEILAVLGLVLLNGLLAMSELAIVSARRLRLKRLADDGRRDAAAALALAEDPGRFLSTVQIGITLVGIVAGAVSGATLAGRLAGAFQAWGMPPGLAEPFAYALVVAAIAFLSVVVGELVPKQVALRDPERVALAVARPMTWLSRLAAPAVAVLDGASRAVLALLGSREREDRVTEEDIRSMVAAGETAGVVEPEEHRMISGVLRLGDRSVRAMMTPRPEVDVVDLDADAEALRRAARASTHSRLVAVENSPDHVVGVIHSKRLLDALIDGRAADARALLEPAPSLPDRADALEAIAQLKESPNRMAIVVDEYGAFEGIVTTADVLQAITGAFPDEDGVVEGPAVRRDDGSWLLEGAMPVDEVAELLELTLPAARSYHTLAGLILDRLHRVPDVGSTTDVEGWRFEVVDMDGRRVDKVLAYRRPARHRQ